MNIGQFNIPLQNKILSTYSVGKYAKTLYEKEGSTSSYVTKSRDGIIISISDDAKKLFTKAKQIKYQHGTPVDKKNSATSAVFEKIDGNYNPNIPNSKDSQRKASNREINYEQFVSIEKTGFVISGITNNTDSQEEIEPSKKLKDLFEIETLREPGSLVNVLV